MKILLVLAELGGFCEPVKNILGNKVVDSLTHAYPLSKRSGLPCSGERGGENDLPHSKRAYNRFSEKAAHVRSNLEEEY